MSNFTVNAGNGRLYKPSPDKKQNELDRLKKLREEGQAWATDDKAHDYDGFLQIGQNLIDWLQEGLNQSSDDLMRMNWKGKVEKTDNGAVLQIKDAWIGNGMMDLKKFTESGGKVSGGKHKSDPKHAPSSDDDFLDDDEIPF